MVPRMPVSSRAEVAPARSASAVPRTHQGRGDAPRGGHADEASEGARTPLRLVKVAEVKVGDAVFGGPKLVLIAGPCVIESEDSALRHATRIAEIARKAGFPYVFKSSFDKANRTSHASFRGPGLEAGVPVLTDIHEVAQAHPAAEVVDIIQIPAFLIRQTDLVHEAARTRAAINLKKGQFLSPNEMKSAVAKAEDAGSR